MEITGNVQPASLDVLKNLPDPLFKYNFDLYSVSAETEVARIIGKQCAQHPQFLSLQKLEIVVRPDLASTYDMLGTDLPAHSLRMVFLDLNFDQAQLDARTALMNSKLSQLVIRQFSGPDVVRYLVFTDLTPETVKFNLDGSANSGEIVDRAMHWKFKSMQESKAFPGAL